MYTPECHRNSYISRYINTLSQEIYIRTFSILSWVIFPTTFRVFVTELFAAALTLSSPNCIISLTDTIILLVIWIRLAIWDIFTHSAPSSSNYDLSPRVIIPSSLPPCWIPSATSLLRGFHHLRLKSLKEPSGWLPGLHPIICHPGLRSAARQHAQPLASPNTSSGIWDLSNLSLFSRKSFNLYSQPEGEAIFHTFSCTKSPSFSFKTLAWILHLSFLLISFIKTATTLGGPPQNHFPPSSMIKEVHNDVSVFWIHTILISIICFGPSLCSNGYGVFILPKRHIYLLCRTNVNCTFHSTKTIQVT